MTRGGGSTSKLNPEWAGPQLWLRRSGEGGNGSLEVRLHGGRHIELHDVPPKTGLVGRPINRPQIIDLELQQKVVASVKAQLGKAAEDVLVAIASRFPSSDTLDAHALAYPELWCTEGLKEDAHDMQQRLKKIKELYCKDVELPSGVLVKAPLDAVKLHEQYSVFFHHAQQVDKSMQPSRPRLTDDEEAEADGPPFEQEEEVAIIELLPLRTSMFWRELSRSPATADAISEWLKMGELVLVKVHGSCEDERMFSAMAYLKHCQSIYCQSIYCQ
jgi:hypothetical protein